jgi:hypothetical protein
MQLFEYHEERVHNDNHSYPDSLPMLNRLGKSGWELISVCQEFTNSMSNNPPIATGRLYTFKRAFYNDKKDVHNPQ